MSKTCQIYVKTLLLEYITKSVNNPINYGATAQGHSYK